MRVRQPAKQKKIVNVGLDFFRDESDDEDEFN